MHFIVWKINKTRKINLRVLKTRNGKTMLLSKYVICYSTKWRFIKKQEASVTLCSLGLKTPSNKIPLLGDILF